VTPDGTFSEGGKDITRGAGTVRGTRGRGLCKRITLGRLGVGVIVK